MMHEVLLMSLALASIYFLYVLCSLFIWTYSQFPEH